MEPLIMISICLTILVVATVQLLRRHKLARLATRRMATRVSQEPSAPRKALSWDNMP